MREARAQRFLWFASNNGKQAQKILPMARPGNVCSLICVIGGYRYKAFVKLLHSKLLPADSLKRTRQAKTFRDHVARHLVADRPYAQQPRITPVALHVGFR